MPRVPESESMTQVSLEPQEPTVLSREPSRALLGAPRSPHLIERAAVDEQHVRPPLRIPSFPWTPFPGRRGPVCSRLCPECRCFRRERGWASPSPCPPSPTPVTGKKQSSEDQGTGTGHPFSVPGFIPTVLSLENDPERARDGREVRSRVLYYSRSVCMICLRFRTGIGSSVTGYS